MTDCKGIHKGKVMWVVGRYWYKYRKNIGEIVEMKCPKHKGWIDIEMKGNTLIFYKNTLTLRNEVK
ncbi:MAG: hypothetical protein QXL94_01655 [Candidatus Parvarchaeum sp.]